MGLYLFKPTSYLVFRIFFTAFSNLLDGTLPSETAFLISTILFFRSEGINNISFPAISASTSG